jgi:hypothetical protein
MLSNLCDKIMQVSSLLNANVRRAFSLECLYFGSEFLPKDQLMAKLEDYETLINSMGALFYISKRMVGQVPCCFESWKSFAFEQRASKLHEMLSTGTLASA